MEAGWTRIKQPAWVRTRRSQSGPILWINKTEASVGEELGSQAARVGEEEAVHEEQTKLACAGFSFTVWNANVH